MDGQCTADTQYIPSRKVSVTLFDFSHKRNGSTISRKISQFNILRATLQLYLVDICIMTDRQKKESLLLALRRNEYCLKVCVVVRVYKFFSF